MTLRTLENAILVELRTVAKNPKLRLKDLLEWSTSEVSPHEGETVVYLPVLKVWCAIKKELNRGANG
jgi:hypothetical protein